MAEETQVTQTEGQTTDPQASGNSDGTTTTQTDPQSQATPVGDQYGDLTARLEQIEQERDEWRQRYAASTTEFQRLQQQNQQFEQQLREVQQRTQPQTQSPQKLSIREILDGYMQGDYAKVDQFEQQMAQQEQERQRQDQVKQLQQFAQSKNQQLTQALVSDFPELNDKDSDLYKYVYSTYDKAQTDPFWQASKGLVDDPSVMTIAYDPMGYGSKNVDMRIVRDLATRYRLQNAAEQGRQEEHQRLNNPMLQPSGARTTSQQADPGPLITEAEMEAIDQFVRDGTAQRNGWGKTKEDVIKKRWEKLMTPEEKTVRMEAWRSGTWNPKTHVSLGMQRRQ